MFSLNQIHFFNYVKYLLQMGTNQKPKFKYAWTLGTSPQYYTFINWKTIWKKKTICIKCYSPSSCKIFIRLSLVTLYIPAVKISLVPLFHKTVSFIFGTMTTHVRSASFPSKTVDGPPVPVIKQSKTEKNEY